MVQIQCPVCSLAFHSERSSVVPFCSERCQQLDLGRWLNEEYSIACIADPDEESEFEELHEIDPGRDAGRMM